MRLGAAQRIACESIHPWVLNRFQAHRPGVPRLLPHLDQNRHFLRTVVARVLPVGRPIALLAGVDTTELFPDTSETHVKLREAIQNQSIECLAAQVGLFDREFSSLCHRPVP